MRRCKKPPTERFVLGIDPGKYGAIASLDLRSQTATVEDFPLTADGQPDYATLASLVQPYRRDAIAVVEQVNGHNMGRQSAFNFGANFGAWLALLAGFEISTKLVAPSVWKPALDLSRGKSEALDMARAEFPALVDRLRRKKDDGRAEALLLIRYGLM